MIIFAAAVVVVILAQTILHYFERRELYNRIMSGSLAEYKRNTGKAKKPETAITRHQEVMKAWRDPNGR